MSNNKGKVGVATHSRMTPVAHAVGSMGRKAESGFSLVELMLVIGVAAGMAAATIAFGSRVWESQKVANSRELSMQVAREVEAKFATFPNFITLDSTSGDWITSLGKQGNDVSGPWGPVKLHTAGINTMGDTWAMSFQKVPKSACVQMLSTMGASYYGSAVNGSFSVSEGGKSVDPAEANALCNAGENTVSFIGKPMLTANVAPVSAAWNPPPPSSLPVWSGGPAPAPAPTPGPSPSPGPAPTPAPPAPLPSPPGPPPSGGGGCFAPDTLVLTERGPVAIKDIQAGDRVASLWIRDLEVDDTAIIFEWRAESVPDAFDYVEVVHAHRGSEPGYYRINGHLDATWEHPFMVNRSGSWQWVRARDLAVGDRLRALDGEHEVSEVEYVEQAISTRNLDVISPYDNFLVMLGGRWVVVHNLMMSKL